MKIKHFLISLSATFCVALSTMAHTNKGRMAGAY